MNTNRRVSWQQGMMTAIVLFVVVPSLFTVVFPTRRDDRKISIWALAIAVPATAVLLAWHRRDNVGTDLYRDQLQLYFPISQILHLDDCHLTFKVSQKQSLLVIQVFLQNVRAGEGRFEMSFQTKRGGEFLMNGVPDLSMSLPGAAFVVARTEVALCTSRITTTGEIEFLLVGNCATHGRKVRFGKPTPFSRKASHSPILMGAMAFGYISWGGGTYLKVPLRQTPERTDVGARPSWQVHTLWTPENPGSPEDTLNHVM